jgi:hypothetical protein
MDLCDTRRISMRKKFLKSLKNYFIERKTAKLRSLSIFSILSNKNFKLETIVTLLEDRLKRIIIVINLLCYRIKGF